MENELLKFKSGSDIRGTAAEGVEGQPIELTDERVDRMAKGFYLWLSKRNPDKKLKISLGHDSRISAPRLSKCVKNALKSCGAEVIFTGLSSTPAMFMTTQLIDCDGAIQLTASHHPFNKNGLKFFAKNGGLEGSDITEILNYAFENQFPTGEGSVTEVDFMSTYSQVLVDFVRKQTGAEKPLEGFKVVVDAGNGAGGFYVDDVLKPLGADTEGSQFLDPDGRFPNHIPNPENPVAMKFICDKVKAVNADFGIIFDTDVDRAGAVDDLGEEINRNKLIALISAILLEEKGGAYIVTDSITSDGLAEFIAKKGGVHHRFKRGYKNVINEAVRLNKEGKYCPLAIETSGHAALQENYFLDDGAYLVTRLLVKMAKLKGENKKLRDLIADLKLPEESAEIRMGFKADVDFKEYGKGVIADLEQHAVANGWKVAPSNYEGIRISFGAGEGDGWFLLRMSLHDPIMPLNIESDVKGGNLIIAKKLLEFLNKYDGLVVDNLSKFVG
ncbi:MAG: phosphomannomutase/phosphoglucomutase [Clostridia bacterium]|nr:phosphomannomutase/phosphoglucomutase [Clostridia bacterium]